MSSGWTCERPGFWKLGVTGWTARYGHRLEPYEDSSETGWWLQSFGRLIPAGGQPFATLAAAQEYAATHWPNGQEVHTQCLETGRCARVRAHQAHEYWHPPSKWCPGVSADDFPERCCARHDNHEQHNWWPGTTYPGGKPYAGYHCPGYGRATITSDMGIEEITAKVRGALNKDQRRALAERLTHPAFNPE